MVHVGVFSFVAAIEYTPGGWFTCCRPNFTMNRSGAMRLVFERSKTYSARAAGAEIRKATAPGQESVVIDAADIFAVRRCAVDGNPPQLDARQCSNL
jgi:hypothetical protein